MYKFNKDEAVTVVKNQSAPIEVFSQDMPKLEKSAHELIGEIHSMVVLVNMKTDALAEQLANVKNTCVKKIKTPKVKKPLRNRKTGLELLNLMLVHPQEIYSVYSMANKLKMKKFCVTSALINLRKRELIFSPRRGHWKLTDKAIDGGTQLLSN